jgi:hypothetical protein
MTDTESNLLYLAEITAATAETLLSRASTSKSERARQRGIMISVQRMLKGWRATNSRPLPVVLDRVERVLASTDKEFQSALGDIKL